MCAYKQENQYIVKRNILGKDITICVPNKLAEKEDKTELLIYIDKQVDYWTKKIQTNKVQQRTTSSRQKIINEKKIMKRGDGKKRKTMTWEEKKEDNYRINRAAYGIKCKYDNVKKSVLGKYYIVRDGFKAELVYHGGEYLTYSDVMKRPIKGLVADRFKTEASTNFSGFEDISIIEICQDGRINLWKDAGRFGFSNLNGDKMAIDEIDHKDFKALLPCEVEFEYVLHAKGEAVFTNAYEVDWFLDACAKYKPTLVLEDLWKDYCYVALQLYLGSRCKDPVALLLAPMFPVPDEVAKLLSLYSPFVLPDTGLTIYYLPHQFDCQGSRFSIYNISYVNNYVKPRKICYAWSYEDYKDDNNVTYFDIYNNYVPHALIKFVEDRNASMSIFRTGFMAVAWYIAAMWFTEKENFVPTSKYFKRLDLMTKLYTKLDLPTILEGDDDSEYSEHEDLIGLNEVCVKTEKCEIEKLNPVLQSLVSDLKIEMSDVVGLTSPTRIPFATVGFTPG